MDTALIMKLSYRITGRENKTTNLLAPAAERRIAFSLLRQQAENIMSTSDDYRAMAEECFRWARQALTEDKRQAYLDVARTWLEAASSQECGPPAQTPTLWTLNPKH
jgi:hypothetical protein